ncbi:MAG: hypothetical protein ACLQVL_34495 [Terriglobia bacterium]
MAFRKTSRRVLTALLSAFLLFAALAVLDGVWVRASARALIESAKDIRTTADAERQISVWRGSTLAEVIEERPNRFGEQNYTIRLTNSILWRIRVVPPTVLGMTIIMRRGDLRSIIVVMTSGWRPNTTSGVWVQEWFDSDASGTFHVGLSRRPLSGTVEFSSSIPEPERSKAFALNADCFVNLGGCGSAEDILPGVWQLGTAPQ